MHIDSHAPILGVILGDKIVYKREFAPKIMRIVLCTKSIAPLHNPKHYRYMYAEITRTILCTENSYCPMICLLFEKVTSCAIGL